MMMKRAFIKKEKELSPQKVIVEGPSILSDTASESDSS
jgi:hypothetical protein